MAEVRMARRRDGAFFWDLFVDVADPERYVEVYLMDSWLEHLRQHERVTEQDRRWELVAREHVEGGAPRSVTHLLSVGARVRRPPRETLDSPSDPASNPVRLQRP
jgi:hypothetical protein